MKQYISKSDLVAEIEKRRDGIKKGIFSIPLTGSDRAFATFEYEILGKIKHFLNTLEVKEAKEELVSNNLEEAASQYSFNIPSAIFNDLTPVLQNIWKREIEGAFIAGAKWQEEQIMKDAIEREVKEDAGGYPYIDATELYDYDKDIPLAKEGDIVKIVLKK